MFMQVKNGERFYGESGRESAIFNPLEPGVAFSQLLFRGLQGLWCTSFRSSRHLVM